MGVLDRINGFGQSFGADIGGMLSGVGGATKDVFGIVYDLAIQAPFTDDEYDGFVDTLSGVLVDRGANAAQNMFGPEEGFGAFARMMPRTVRQPIASGASKVMHGAEFVRREYIAEPLATFALAGSLAETEEYGGSGGWFQDFGNLFNGALWKEAHDLSQEISIGQAVVLGLQNRDILDDADLANAMDSDMFHFLSGSVDLYMRIFREPDVLIGKTVKLVRLRQGAHGATMLAPVASKLPVVGHIPVGRTGYNVNDAIAAQFQRLTNEKKVFQSTIFGNPHKRIVRQDLQALNRQQAAGLRYQARLIERADGDLDKAADLRRQADLKFDHAAERVIRKDAKNVNKKGAPSVEDDAEGAFNTVDVYEDEFKSMVEDIIDIPGEEVTTYDLQARYKIDMKTADEIMDILEETGTIGPSAGNRAKPRITRKANREAIYEKLAERQYRGISRNPTFIGPQRNFVDDIPDVIREERDELKRIAGVDESDFQNINDFDNDLQRALDDADEFLSPDASLNDEIFEGIPKDQLDTMMGETKEELTIRFLRDRYEAKLAGMTVDQLMIEQATDFNRAINNDNAYEVLFKRLDPKGSYESRLRRRNQPYEAAETDEAYIARREETLRYENPIDDAALVGPDEVDKVAQARRIVDGQELDSDFARSIGSDVENKLDELGLVGGYRDVPLNQRLGDINRDLNTRGSSLLGIDDSGEYWYVVLDAEGTAKIQLPGTKANYEADAKRMLRHTPTKERSAEYQVRMKEGEELLGRIDERGRIAREQQKMNNIETAEHELALERGDYYSPGRVEQTGSERLARTPGSPYHPVSKFEYEQTGKPGRNPKLDKDGNWIEGELPNPTRNLYLDRQGPPGRKFAEIHFLRRLIEGMQGTGSNIATPSDLARLQGYGGRLSRDRALFHRLKAMAPEHFVESKANPGQWDVNLDADWDKILDDLIVDAETKFNVTRPADALEASYEPSAREVANEARFRITTEGQADETARMAAAEQIVRDENLSLPARRRKVFLSFGSPRWREVENRITYLKKKTNPEGKRQYSDNQIGSMIHEGMMKKHPQADMLSSLLAHADDSAQRELIWRIALGDFKANKELLLLNEGLHIKHLGLMANRSAVQTKLDDISVLNEAVERQFARPAGEKLAPGEANYARLDYREIDSNVQRVTGQLEYIDAQLDSVKTAVERDRNMMQLFNQWTIHDARNRPIQNYIKATQVYQDSKYGGVVRMFADGSAHNTIPFADPNATELYRRALKAMGYNDAQVGDLAGKFDGATFDERYNLFMSAESDALERMGKHYNLTKEQINIIKAAAKRGQTEFAEILEHSDRAKQFDGAGRAIVNVPGDVSGEIIVSAIATTQLRHTAALMNWKEINRRMRNAARSSYFKDFKDYYDVVDVGPISRTARQKLDDAREAHEAVRGRTRTLREKADDAKALADEEFLGQVSPYKGDSVGPISAARRKTAENFHLTRTSEITVDVMERVMSVWKPTVLLRPAWTLRVVLMDEQFRMMSKFGVMESLLGSGTDFRNLWAQSLEMHPAMKKVLKTERKGKMAVGGAIAGGLVGGVPGAAMGAVLAGGGSKMLNILGDIEKAGFPSIGMNGYRINQAFGVPGDNAQLYAERIASSEQIGKFVRRGEKNLLNALRPEGQSWQVHTWQTAGDANAVTANQEYVSEWIQAMKNHAMSDEMMRKFMDGSSRDNVIQWLNQTPEGINHADRLPLWGRTPEGRANWVDGVAGQIDAYTGFRQEIRDELMRLGPDAKFEEYEAILMKIPVDERAVIHGREFEQIAAGPSSVTAWLGRTVESAYATLAAAPTDHLSRMPTFRRFYEAELRRTLGSIPASELDDGGVAIKQLMGMEEHARRFALKETKDLMYDLAENSEFGEMTRLIMPFFPAFQEVLTRWAGLAWENPNLAFLADEVWRAPSRMGIATTDEQGNDYITIRLPDFAKGLASHSIFGQGFDAQAQVRFRQDSFNMVAQGTPGFGPWATIPVSIAARARPELEESLDFIIPFGPTESSVGGVVSAFMSPTIMKINSVRRKEDDRAYVNGLNRILQTKLVDAELGLRPPVDYDNPLEREAFMKEVEDEAKSFSMLRIVAGLFSPVVPNFDSPYKLHMDIFRAIRNRDWDRADDLSAEIAPGSRGRLEALYNQENESAEAVFLTVFGEEYFALTQGFTQTLDGVPPTLEGVAAREEYQDIIERFPDWGGVIVGNEGGDTVKFSRTAYGRQLTEPLTAGSESNQRERLSPLEIMQAPDIQLGWDKFAQGMESLDVIRIDRGLANFSVKAAEDLRQMKAQLIETLAKEHPAWWREYNTVDRLKMPERIAGARAIVIHENSGLRNRPDIRGLAEYLELRDRFIEILQNRAAAGGARSLTATGNMDVAAAWETARLEIVERNLPFADIYYRRFVRDDLTVE